MLINNLPHFEAASENTAIAGAAATLVTAYAVALGPSTRTFTRTTATTRPLPRGGSLSIGRGFGFARGAYTDTEVFVAGDGDIVAGRTHSTPNVGRSPVDVSHGVIVAIDLPGHA